jgi:hypothetical protein
MTPRELRQALHLSGPVFYLQAIAGGLMIAAVVAMIPFAICVAQAIAWEMWR